MHTYIYIHTHTQVARVARETVNSTVCTYGDEKIAQHTVATFRKCLYVCLCVSVSVCLSMCQKIVQHTVATFRKCSYKSIFMYVLMSQCLSICLSVCLCVYVSVCLSVFPSVCSEFRLVVIYRHTSFVNISRSAFVDIFSKCLCLSTYP